MKFIRIILALINLIIAFCIFDRYDFDRSVASILLVLSSVLLISTNEKLNGIVRRISITIVIFLFLKLIFIG